MEREIVITGMGAVTPVGIGVAEFWNGLLAGRRVVHLAGAHQRDVSAGAARLPGGRVDLPADALYIFLNRHSCKPPCLYITE